MQPPSIEPEAVVQFVFDNFDLNVATINGKDTVHYMAGMASINPKSALKTDFKVLRKVKLSTCIDETDLNFITVTQVYIINK
jgi:hypothetical protein